MFLDLFICAFSYNSKESMKIFSVQTLLGKVLGVEEESQNLFKTRPVSTRCDSCWCTLRQKEQHMQRHRDRNKAWSIQRTGQNSLARNEPGNMVGEETKCGLRLDS